LLRLWLRAHPASLGQKTMTFDDVRKAPDKDAVADQVIGRQLNESSWPFAPPGENGIV